MSALPKLYGIPNAPGFQIRFTHYGEAIDSDDCVNTLILAESKLLTIAPTNPTHRKIPQNSYASGTANLSLMLQPTLVHTDAALFMAGIMEWGSQYGFTQVGDMRFINPQGASVATGTLGLSGKRAAIPPSIASTATASPPNTIDQPLWPIPNVPDYFLCLKPSSKPLSCGDSRRTLEAADTALLYAYHQAPIGVDPKLTKTQTWTEGAVSFTITPTSELTAVSAGLFVLGVLQWGSESGFAEADIEFIRRKGGPGGELEHYGTGKLSSVGRAIS